MKLSTGFNSLNLNPTSQTGESRIIYPARVVDVILDEKHPEYEKYGKDFCIGAIKYCPIDRILDESNPVNFPIAYPLDPSLRKLPLRNEIVLLISAPSRDISTSRSTEYVHYYTDIISLWNTNINPAPSLNSTDTELDYGYEYQENSTGLPLHPFNGDVILQGRHGQSIRMSGARSFKNTLSNKENAGEPLMIFSNGYTPTSNNSGFYVEDINKDKSSIYFAANHTLPLEQSRDKFAGATDRPTLTKNYTGNQILLNSDRLTFNTKKSDIIFYSKEHFSVTANNLSLDAATNLGLDGKKIYLGEKAVRFELEPVILGNQLELFLDTLLSELLRVANAFKKARTVDGKVIPVIMSEGFTLEAVIKSLQNRINPNGNSQLKSKKVFTE